MVGFLHSSGNNGDDLQEPKSPTRTNSNASNNAQTQRKKSTFLSPTQVATSLADMSEGKRRGSLVPETPESNKLRIVLIGGGGKLCIRIIE